MHHGMHSKQVVYVDGMHAANDPFPQKFGLSYGTVSFYRMARWLSIIKTVLHQAFLSEKVTPAQCLYRDVAGLHAR